MSRSNSFSTVLFITGWPVPGRERATLQSLEAEVPTFMVLAAVLGDPDVSTEEEFTRGFVGPTPRAVIQKDNLKHQSPPRLCEDSAERAAATT